MIPLIAVSDTAAVDVQRRGPRLWAIAQFDERRGATTTRLNDRRDTGRGKEAGQETDLGSAIVELAYQHVEARTNRGGIHDHRGKPCTWLGADEQREAALDRTKRLCARKTLREIALTKGCVDRP